MKANNIITLNKKSYQSFKAHVYAYPSKVKPFSTITIYGNNFTAFRKRGNPGVPVLIDNRPLTGTKMGYNGKFKIKMKLPPFKPGKHIISVFGVEAEIEVMETEEIITQQDLKGVIERDFVLVDDCHMLLSDEKYRVCPIDILKCYLNKSEVSRKKYIAEWFDCDDFSDALHGQFTFDTYPHGYAHGELWVIMPGGGGHAINCFLVKDGAKIKMVVVEPQSGNIFDFPKTWKAFMVKI